MSDAHVPATPILPKIFAFARVVALILAFGSGFGCMALEGGRYGNDVVEAIGRSAAAITFSVLVFALRPEVRERR